MDNDKVQPVEPKVIRKSKIKIGVQRTLSTAKYESIVIHNEIEEDIEWSSLDERQRKIKNWETILVQGFKQCHDSILQELNLSHKRAYFVDNLDKDRRPDGTTHELDSLDPLE